MVVEVECDVEVLLVEAEVDVLEVEVDLEVLEVELDVLLVLVDLEVEVDEVEMDVELLVLEVEKLVEVEDVLILVLVLDVDVEIEVDVVVAPVSIRTSSVHQATAPLPDNEALQVTEVPEVAVAAFWVTIALDEKPGPVFEVCLVWLLPAVKVTPPVSPPKPMTSELLAVVVTEAVGALEPALLNVLFAPVAPEPFVPVMSIPVKVM